MTYGESIAYLHALSQFGFHPGLGTTLELAAAVGNPHNGLRFLHVAGTNGKGSTCAMLESIYRQSGLRVGLYTSPHLVKFGERIQVNRELIPDGMLAQWTTLLAEVVADRKLTPTFFEFTTVLALCWFAECRCDLVVWETGLGGRLDSTNIVTPLVSVITSIGWDHMQVLGPTLAAIAGEKAGIIKPGIPVVALKAPREARSVIERRASELGAPCRLVGADEVEALDYEVSLTGPHQKVNAALAVATVEMAKPAMLVSAAMVRSGLASVVWMGRLQLVQRRHQTVILDGAHNRDGIESLRIALTKLCPTGKVAVIAGFLADKEWEAMAGLLAGLASCAWAVPVASSRTLHPQQLVTAMIRTRPELCVKPMTSLAAALDDTRDQPFLLITGSLYLVGEAIECLGVESASYGNQRELNEWGGGTKP